MALAEVMDAMRESLQRSLDELISPRAALKSKMQALRSLECALAKACFAPTQDGSSLVKDAFMALQYTFQCNVPAHLLSWIMAATARLEAALSKSAGDDHDGRAAELADELVVQLSLALSLIQGVTLNHEASKHYLGRRSALEILLDLLLVSRHVGAAASQSSSDSTHGSSSSSSTTTSTSSTPLTSIVLDTLLCILVDSSKALRAFEEANGVQSIVKILKRAGTPREVRMKCLEFLYFYLLDETPNLDTVPASAPAAPRQSPKEPIPTPPPTAPVTPARGAKPYLSATPMRPSGASASRHGSSSSSLAFSLISSPGVGSNPNSSVGTPAATLSTSASSTSSSRSTSGSSTSNHSFCSTASDASASTTASSMPASPEKIARSTAGTGPRAKGKEVSPGPGLLPRLSSAKRMLTPITNRQQQQQHQPTSPTSPTSPPVHSSSSPPSPPAGGGGPTANSRFPQLRSMMMLRKEVDYVPQSPVKKGAAGPGPGPATPGHRSGPATPSSSHGLAPKAAGHRKSLSASASLHVPRFALTSTSMSASHSRGEVEADGGGVLGSRSPPPVPPLPSQARAHHRRQHTMSGAGIGERDRDRERERERDIERNREKEKEGEREFKKREGDWRTTAEKRELLGTMLGNVDALVESVSRAGIWGLG